jgi:gliding motility-associated lipoprotein GldH
MRALIFSIFIGLLILVTTSCNTDVVFEQLEEVESSGWNYKDPVSFTFTAPDTTNKYNLIFDVRITPDYAYQNLWLFIETKEPDGFTHLDSINCPMAYPDGRWVGNGLGDLIDNPILIHRSFKFTKMGDYTLKIKHGMRNDNLPHIQNLGVILKRIKS